MPKGTSTRIKLRALLFARLSGTVFEFLFCVVRVLFWAFCRLKYSHALVLARMLTPLFTLLTNRRRLRNLKKFFGPSGWTEAQYRELNARYTTYLARLGVEIARLLISTPAGLIQQSNLAGEEHLKRALAGGRGVLLISGHIGTWWFVPTLLAARGYRVRAVFNSMPVPSIEDYFFRLARHCDVKLTFVGKGAHKGARQAFQNNEIFYLAFDGSDRESQTVWLPFGSTTIGIDRGTAILALRYRVPVLQASCAQVHPGGARIAIRPAADSSTITSSDRAEELLHQWLQTFHEEVLEHPDQWWPWTFVEMREAKNLAPRSAELVAGPEIVFQKS